MKLIKILSIFLLASGADRASVSSLYVGGYTLIPEPQKTALSNADFQLDNTWRLELGTSVKANDIAPESVREQLSERYGLNLGTRGESRLIELRIQPDSVQIGDTTDPDKAAVKAQAYRMDLDQQRIRITANAAPGLFYGVQTLVQLVKAERGRLWLPKCEILGWPHGRLLGVVLE